MNTVEQPAAGDAGANSSRASDERNAIEEIPENPTPVPILPEKPTTSDAPDEQELLLSPITGGNDEIVESTPTPSPPAPLTSTPTGHILPVPPRRRVLSPSERSEDGASVSQASQGLVVQHLQESALSTSSQSASVPAVTSVHVLSEESELLVPAEHHTRRTVVERKRNQEENEKDEEMQDSIDGKCWAPPGLASPPPPVL